MLDKEAKARIVDDFMKHEWWKILSSEIVKLIEHFDKKLTREWMKESDMLNDHNNLQVYTKYDLYALTRNKLKEIVDTPEKIIKDWITIEVNKDFRREQL